MSRPGSQPTGGSSYTMHLLEEENNTPKLKRFLQDFKRDPNSAFFTSNHPYTRDETGGNGPHYDLRRAAFENAHSGGLMRRLKGRHLQMIAMGGSIGTYAYAIRCLPHTDRCCHPGTGLFVASGKSLAVGGPASLLLAFSAIGIMLYCTCQALGELAVLFPLAGSFSSWATRFLDPSWGFAMGWKYVLPSLCRRFIFAIRCGTDSVEATRYSGFRFCPSRLSPPH